MCVVGDRDRRQLRADSNAPRLHAQQRQTNADADVIRSLYAPESTSAGEESRIAPPAACWRLDGVVACFHRSVLGSNKQVVCVGKIAVDTGKR